MSLLSKIEFVSDASILISFEGQPSLEVSAKVISLFNKFSKLKDFSITNLHPAYCSLLVDFDLRFCEPKKIFDYLSQELKSDHFNDASTCSVVEIPVTYDGEDLAEVAQITGFSQQEVIRIHSEAEYRVAFLGFAPGFPYLLGLPESLVCPRKKTPRLKVPAGSVAIARTQTGIYPTASPGGWQLLGRTDVNLFDFNKSSPSLLKPGDKVRFVPTTKSSISNQVVESSAEKKESILKIENPGFFSTLQDQGRFNCAHLGVSPGGAADKIALRLGNQLVGNSENAVALEMTISGATVTFLKDTWFTVTGADCSPTLDQFPVAMWTSIPVSAGQRLVANSISHNLRSYLCVYGGAGIYKEGVESPRFRKVKNSILDIYQEKEKVLRVTLGPQVKWFSEESRKIFFESEFEVTNDVNRLGIRLSGTKLEYDDKYQGQELVSEGIANGAIQVAQAGQAFILYCEQQTTGGYPKIANVINADLFRLGQLKPGDRLRFVETSLDEAWQIQHDQERILETAVYDF